MYMMQQTGDLSFFQFFNSTSVISNEKRTISNAYQIPPAVNKEN